ncbi:MAG: hypothetical protein P8Z75_14205 [Gammaproteobacteria bacterium]|jgi:hypothetical protein
MSLESGKNTATLIAFVLAPLVSALLYPFTSPAFHDMDIIDFGVSVTLFYFFCSLATLVAGMPLYFILRRFNLVRWWTATTCGIVIGAIVAVLVSLNNPVHDKSLVFFASVGAITGFCFWLFRYLGKRYARPSDPES